VRQENSPKNNFHKLVFGIDEKAKRLKYIIFKPLITITYITLESWKMMIIVILKKEVPKWIK
jgi:hypothetical protein